jgi:hypothetical protein
MAHAAVVAGVQQRDAGIDRGLDGGDALGVVNELRACRDAGSRLARVA